MGDRGRSRSPVARRVHDEGFDEHYSRDSPEDAKYRTQMFEAIKNDNFAAVRQLLLAKPSGFDINSLDPQGYSFLHHAVLKSRGRVDIAHALIAAGADVNRPKQGTAADRFGTAYPILDSAIIGDLDMVKLLIRNGAVKEVRSRRGLTPFLEALREPDGLEMLAYLALEAGVDYRARSEGGNAFDILRETLTRRQGDDIDRVQNVLAFLFVLFRGDPQYAVEVEDAEVGDGVRRIAADFGMTIEQLREKVEEFKPLLGSPQSRKHAILLYGQRARERAAARTGAAAGAGAGAAPEGGRRRRQKTHRRRARRSRRVKQRRTLRR